MRRRLAVLAGTLAALGLASAAAAEAPTWAVLPLVARGVDPAAVDTVASLLRGEIGHAAGVRVVAPAQPGCADVGCAVVSGRAAGAAVVVWGEVSALGNKIIVTVWAADTGAEPRTSLHREAAERVEDLDGPIVRLAAAIAARARTAAPAPAPAPGADPYARVDGSPAAPPARPPVAPAPPPPPPAPPPRPLAMGPPDPDATGGSVTFMSGAAPLPMVRRRPMRPFGDVAGGALQVGAFLPLAHGYAGNPGGAGLALALAYWYEAEHLAIEARLGVRFDLVDGGAGYAEVPIDLGCFYLLSTGDAVPFVGGGVGYHYLWDRTARTIVTGTTLPATTEVTKSGDGWGPAIFLRAGVLFGRSHNGRLALTVEYGALFAKINGFETPQSVTLGGTLTF